MPYALCPMHVGYLMVLRRLYIVSGWRGMIKSKSIIPHFPTHHGLLPIIRSAAGIDIIGDR